MLTHDGCRTPLAYFSVYCIFHSLSLCACRYYAEHIFTGAKCGDCEGKRCFGHFGKCFEAAVIYLLLAANQVKLCRLYKLCIIKICNAGVIKCNVAVFTDAEANDVNRIILQEFCVSCTFGFNICCATVDEVYTLKRNLIENSSL